MGGSALNKGTGGRLKLELGWKSHNMAFRSETTQILIKISQSLLLELVLYTILKFSRVLK